MDRPIMVSREALQNIYRQVCALRRLEPLLYTLLHPDDELTDRARCATEAILENQDRRFTPVR